VNDALDFTGSAGGAFLTVLDPPPPTVPSPTANEGVFKLILNYDLDVLYDSIMNTTAKFPRSTYTEMTAASTDLSVFAIAAARWSSISRNPVARSRRLRWSTGTST